VTLNQGRFSYKHNAKMGTVVPDNLFDQETYIYTYENILKNEISQTNETLKRRHFVFNCRRVIWITTI